MSFLDMMVAVWLCATPSPGVDGPVYALAAGSDGLYVAGSFAEASGVEVRNLARWNGVAWSPVAGGVNGPVFALLADGALLYAGGNFTEAGGVSVHNLAVWDGSVWNDVGRGVTGTSPSVKSLAVGATGLLVGGIFSQAGASAANGLARWTGAVWEILGGIPPGIEHDIRTILPLNGTIYVGGVLLFPGTTRPSEGTLARATPFVLANHAGSVNADDECTGCASTEALSTDGSSLFVGGAFTNIGAVGKVQSRYQIVELINETIPFGLGEGANAPSVVSGGMIRALALSGGELYAGGNISRMRGIAVSNIARWNGNAWAPMGNAIDADVYAIAVWDKQIFIAGEFVTAGGVAMNHVARWNAPVWDPLANATTPVESRSWGDLKNKFR